MSRTSAEGEPADARASSVLARERAVAVRAARRAAAAVMSIYSTDFTVRFKDAPADAASGFVGDDPVTAADHSANAIIVDAIAAAFPGDAIVAEESPIPDAFHRARRCWFVDPLDGTREFCARNGEFCVMIGLAIEGRAVLGVVAVPALTFPGRGTAGYVLVGEVGVGAWVLAAAGDDEPVEPDDDGNDTPLTEDARPLRVTAESDAARAVMVVSRSRRPVIVDAISRILGRPREVCCGSVGVKIAKLVSSEADMYVHPTTPDPGCPRDPRDQASRGASKRWDVCGPEAIVRAAGGEMTDATGAAFDYAAPDLTNRAGVVASNGLLHPVMLDAIGAALVASRRE